MGFEAAFEQQGVEDYSEEGGWLGAAEHRQGEFEVAGGRDGRGLCWWVVGVGWERVVEEFAGLAEL